MRRPLSILLAASTVGCYTYTPLHTNAAPATGQQVRVELTQTGSDSLSRVVGPSVQSIDGRLMLSSPEGIELGVTQVKMYSGLEQYWKGEAVTVPKPFIANIDERSFSWGKTGLLGGVIVLMALAITAGAAGGSLFGGGGGGQPK